MKMKENELKSSNNNKISLVPGCIKLQVMLTEIFYLQIQCRA
jgi:hypothetical protein